MSLFNVFDISGSAMGAQTVRMNATASNLANARSVASSVEETYKARHPVFAAALSSALTGQEPGAAPGDGGDAAMGVRVLGVVESEAPLQKRYEPHHPMADEEGYVNYPNVNVVEEMANMISASRSFQVNAELMASARTMTERLLTLGQ